MSTLFAAEHSEDQAKPKIDASSPGQKASSLAKLLLRLDKYDLENLGQMFENNKTRDAYKDLIVDKSSLLKSREKASNLDDDFGSE